MDETGVVSWGRCRIARWKKVGLAQHPKLLHFGNMPSATRFQDQYRIDVMNVFDFAASPMWVCDMGRRKDHFSPRVSIRKVSLRHEWVVWGWPRVFIRMWQLFRSISPDKSLRPSHVSPRPHPPAKIITIMRCLDLWFLSPLGRNNSGFKFASVFRRCGMWCHVGYMKQKWLGWKKSWFEKNPEQSR